MSAQTVKAAPAFLPTELVARFENAGAAAGFRVERFGEVAGLSSDLSAIARRATAEASAKTSCPLLALTKRTPGPRPRIYLSAGIHGDEPAPPLALLEMLEAGVFDARANWFLCPLLNPAGFLRGVRENAVGIDLNRDYKALRSEEIRAHTKWLQRQPNFDLTLCVHEDWESKGYYLYELNPLNRSTLANAMIDAAAKVLPIETARVIDEREVSETGIIRPVADPLVRELWPESIYLRAHHATLGYTIETPSSLPLAQRIAGHRAAIEAALRLASGGRQIVVGRQSC